MRVCFLMLPVVGFQIVSANYFQAVGKPAHVDVPEPLPPGAAADAGPVDLAAVLRPGRRLDGHSDLRPRLVADHRRVAACWNYGVWTSNTEQENGLTHDPGDIVPTDHRTAVNLDMGTVGVGRAGASPTSECRMASRWWTQRRTIRLESAEIVVGLDGC